MTATASRTSQAVAEWTKIFPKQVVENYTSSVTFMKQLTVIAVSTITYLKNAFPEDSYTMECFGGLKLRVLKNKCRDELAHFLSTALTQAFEAFDKKYLHQLALCFYEDECKAENLIEYHVFEYTYTDEGVGLSVRSGRRGAADSRVTFDAVRERTVHLIRACVVIMQTCQNQLPDAYDVSLRLYYNETAPEGYQAPGFNVAADGDDHLEPTLPAAVKLGWVHTPHHTLTARSYIRDTGSSHEAIASQNPPELSQMEHEEFVSSGSEAARAVRCACRRDDVDDGNMLVCQYCSSMQHAACFGLGAARARARHCCTACSDRDPGREPTDPRLVDLSGRKRECLCIFRRALVYCGSVPHVSGSALRAALGVSDLNAGKLLRLLLSHAVIAPPEHGRDLDLTTPQKIDHEQLKAAMRNFFQVAEEETMVDRLLAETFSSQESHHDPVGEVLGPLEKVSLENASKHGTIIDNPVGLNKTIDEEDLTIKQYKEALLSNYQESEEPFNGSSPMKEIQNLGRKRIPKRKINEEDEENRPRLRTGVRTKRARTRAYNN